MNSDSFSEDPAEYRASSDTAKLCVRTILDVIASHGVTDIVCSPGSRNAPLLIGIAARPAFTPRIVIDERAAGFIAVGIAQVTRRPVALVCTSGTALLNYAPAVAEAYYQGLPLIILSADRPREWIDQDDSQTIRQPGALHNIVKREYDISDREQCDTPGWYEARVANDAMLLAVAGKPGPVHINLRLSPPLDSLWHDEDAEKREEWERRLDAMDSLDGSNPDEDMRRIQKMRRGQIRIKSPRIIERITGDSLPSRPVMEELAETAVSGRILLIGGFMLPDDKLNKAVNRMRQHGNVAVMAETISNLHLPEEDYAIDSAFPLISDHEDLLLTPDIVISFGGALVSRKLKEWLRECGREYPDMEHWTIGASDITADCFQALTLRIDSDPGRFLGALSAEMAHLKRRRPETVSSAVNRYAERWRNIKRKGIERVDSFVRSSEWSDLTAYAEILRRIPPAYNLQISNGTSIRYAQLFQRELPHGVYCNRGTSGIDGTTATAVGASLVFPHPTLLLTGDMSLAYDPGALYTAKRLDSKLKIIVVNNGGGGIFRFIKSTSGLDCREEFFCADPELNFRKLSESLDFRYFRASSLHQLESALDALVYTPGPALLEVVTPPEVSAPILTELLNNGK